jgi:N-acetylmuramoyl-L-alanine amidase
MSLAARANRARAACYDALSLHADAGTLCNRDGALMHLVCSKKQQAAGEHMAFDEASKAFEAVLTEQQRMHLASGSEKAVTAPLNPQQRMHLASGSEKAVTARLNPQQRMHLASGCEKAVTARLNPYPDLTLVLASPNPNHKPSPSPQT